MKEIHQDKKTQGEVKEIHQDKKTQGEVQRNPSG